MSYSGKKAGSWFWRLSWTQLVNSDTSWLSAKCSSDWCRDDLTISLSREFHPRTLHQWILKNPPAPRVRHLRSTDSLCTGSYVAWLQPSYNGRWKPWNSCRQRRLSDSFNAFWRSSTGFWFQTGITLSAWNCRLRVSDSERAASVKMVCSEMF